MGMGKRLHDQPESPLSILNVNFRTRLRGYDPQQVDDFLRSWARKYDDLFTKYVKKCADYERLESLVNDGPKNAPKDRSLEVGQINRDSRLPDLNDIKQYIESIEMLKYIEAEIHQLQDQRDKLEKEIVAKRQELTELEKMKREIGSYLQNLHSILVKHVDINEDASESSI